MHAVQLKFHHIGLLSADQEKSKIQLKYLGYVPGETVFDPLQQVFLSMCTNASGDPAIEIVTPVSDNKALSGFLKRKDEHMYHLCFSTADITTGLEQLAMGDRDRVRQVSAPRPAVLFGGRLVGFYLVSGMGLIELLEDTDPTHE